MPTAAERSDSMRQARPLRGSNCALGAQKPSPAAKAWLCCGACNDSGNARGDGKLPRVSR